MKDFKTFLYPFLVIVIFGICSALIFYHVIRFESKYDIFGETSQAGRFDRITKIIELSVSTVGFVSILVTIIYARISLQRDIQKSSIELFKELRSEKFLQSRRIAWQAMEKWYNEKSYKQALLDFNFSSRLITTDPIFDKDIKAIYQLLEFYSLVSIYEGNELTLKSLRYCYYGWWRHFLYDFAEEIENRTRTNTMLHTQHQNYMESIKYTISLERLDRRCGLSNIPRDTVLHYDGG